MADNAAKKTSTETAELAEKPAPNTQDSSNQLSEQTANTANSSAPPTEVEPTRLQDFNVTESIEQELEQVNAIYQMVVEFFVGYSFQIIGALLILLLGIFVASNCRISHRSIKEGL